MNLISSTASKGLTELIDQELSAPVSAASMAMSDTLRARHGDHVLGIVYYGSCFRTGTEKDGILDIFVIVDDYRSAYANRTLAFANSVLPPNVFYHEMEFESVTLRTKYAVISLKQFLHRTSPKCFHTFYWARFAQPCALTFVRDDVVRGQIVNAISVAIRTFIGRVLPLLPDQFNTETLWSLGLSASYRTELRPEPLGAAARLVNKNISRYQAVTRQCSAMGDGFAAANDVSDGTQFTSSITLRRRWLARQIWRVRRVQGKVINLLRIMKAAFTFDGGVDYVLWKIERHSGVKVESTPMLRKHPLLTCWPTVWRLYRAGAFR